MKSIGIIVPKLLVMWCKKNFFQYTRKVQTVFAESILYNLMQKRGIVRKSHAYKI